MSFTPDRSRWRDVGTAAVAKALTNCGDLVAATTLGLAFQSGGDQGFGVAALLIAAALPLALFGTLAGKLADRWDSRVLIVATAAVQAVICVVLATLHQPVAIIGLVAVLALGSALTQPALSALTPEMVTPEDLPKAMSIGQTAATVGMLAGPALGGLLVGAFGTTIPLLIDAASFLALAVVGLLIQARRGGRYSLTPPATGGSATAAVVDTPAPLPVATPVAAPTGAAATGALADPAASHGPDPGLLVAAGGAASGGSAGDGLVEAGAGRAAGSADAVTAGASRSAAPPHAAAGSGAVSAPGWRLREDPVLRAVLVSISAVIATVMAMGVAEVFFVRETLGSSAFVYGLVSSVWTGGMLLGAWPAARLTLDDVRLGRLQLAILAVLSVIVVASSAVPSAGWLVPLYALGGALNGALNVVVGVVVARRVPRAARGRVAGAFNAAGAGASLCGYLVGGVLLTVLTPRSLIAGAGVASLLVALGFLAVGVTWAARRPVPAAPLGGVD